MMSGGFGGSGRIPRPTCAMGRAREAEDEDGAGRGGFTLFGVHLAADSPPAARPAAPAHDLMMRKSFSMGNLSNYGCPDGASPPSPSPFEQPDSLGSDPRRGDTLARPLGGGSGGDGAAGYASDDLVHATSSSSIRERKKGIPWTEEEHRLFLLGLQKLGKGDWRGISKNFVKTRTPTQVASHAQKYFLRKNNLSKRRRRSSLFDITQENVSSLLDEAVSEEPEFEHVDVCPELTLGQSILHGGDRSIHASMLSRPANNMEEFSTSRPSLPVSCAPVNALKISKNTKKEHKKGIRDSEVCGMDIVGDKVFVHQSPMDISETDCNASIKGGASQSGFQFPLPALWPWPLAAQMHLPWSSSSKIVKPTPILPTPRLSTNDIVKLPEPSVNGARPVMEPTPLSYKLSKEGSRNSAFHTMASATNSELDTQGNLSNAISVP